MGLKKIFTGFLLLCSLCVYLSPRDVILIYDGVKEKSEAFKSVRYIYNLLDCFTIDNKIILSTSEYREMETTVGKQDFIFVVFEEGTPSAPRSLLSDLADTEANIIWINSHIDTLLEAVPGKWGFSFVRSETRQDWRVFYKNEDFPKEDTWMNIICIEDKRDTEVLSWCEDGEKNSFPYVLHSKNLWYFADSPFSYAMEGGRFLILADLLYDIFAEIPVYEHRALVRIEDINPESNPTSLKKIADYLYTEHIPFHLSLIPVYKVPSLQYEVYLSERPELVEALKYAVSRGGAIILHGFTHQHRGITAEDYEFWDDIAGRPISYESFDWVDQRIKSGIIECQKNGLFPIAWETPHYSGSQSNYHTIARYFNTFYDRLMAAELSGTQQIFPYPVNLKDPEITVIPENLGYIDFERPDPQKLLENAQNMLVVRNGMASFFFHPFVPIKHLKTVIKKMKKTGWRFISVKEFDCRLNTDFLWVTSSSGEGQIRLENQYLHEMIISGKGRILKEKYSPFRQAGIMSKKVEVPEDSLFIMEALDLLPEKEEKNFLFNALARLKRFFKKGKNQAILKINNAMVITKETAAPEEKNDQESFMSVLNVFGFNPVMKDQGSLSELLLKEYDLLVVPYASARNLQKPEINAVLGFVERGGNLITDGRTQLAEQLGIKFLDDMVQVNEVKELSIPAQNIYWQPAVNVWLFSTKDALILAKDARSEAPLAVIQPFRRGKVLFFGTIFDPHSPFGVSRFPYFPHYIKNSLGLSLNVKKNVLEFYFDPGLRQDASWEKLVKQWKASGIKIIYLATWHFYRQYAFDYEYFIELCHEHGIAVYAWFELPQVTPLFWEDHSQWREKTATGEDALCHWRLLMNLYNPQSREAVKEFIWKILMDFHWDGINLAELNFDTNEGAQDPAKFTPMNLDVRKAFAAEAGFDPILLFSPDSEYYWKNNSRAFNEFLKFRTDLTKELHIFFLEEISQIMQSKRTNFEVIVTTLDSLAHPEIVEHCGIDTRDIISLMDRFTFTLQIEDPARSWADPPSRYLTYFNIYKKYVRDPERLMFDINVIPTRDISGNFLPSPLATGTELATTVYYAIIPSGRAGIYSEYTIHPFDIDILPFVKSSDVNLNESKGGYLIESKSSFILTLNDPDLVPYIDGNRWPFYGTMGIVVPSGRHFLLFEKEKGFYLQNRSPRILLEGDIKTLEVSGSRYTLTYSSPIPVSLTFSRPLEQVLLDFAPVPLHHDKLGVILPKGEHELEILTGSQSFQVIEKTGYLSSSVFYFLGVCSVLLLSVFYFYSRIKR